MNTVQSLGPTGKPRLRVVLPDQPAVPPAAAKAPSKRKQSLTQSMWRVMANLKAGRPADDKIYGSAQHRGFCATLVGLYQRGFVSGDGEAYSLTEAGLAALEGRIARHGPVPARATSPQGSFLTEDV